jgi:hypothetical protein
MAFPLSRIAESCVPARIPQGNLPESRRSSDAALRVYRGRNGAGMVRKNMLPLKAGLLWAKFAGKKAEFQLKMLKIGLIALNSLVL